MPQNDPRIDRYIESKAEFAQDILSHLRKLVHQACPEIEESIKWNMPFFLYKGSPLCHMAGFKEHCAFGFWRDVHVMPEGKAGSDAMGDLGRISNRADLPKDSALIGYIRKAVEIRDLPVEKKPKLVRKTKPLPPIPPELKAALAKNKKASAEFATFTLSHQREYIEWIADAKREETRAKRVATAIQWISEGKSQNWRYEK